jgi:integrase/recombinase XerC
VRTEIREFLEQHLTGERAASPHTLRNYATDLEMFATFVGDVDPASLDHIRIRQFLADLHAKGAQKASIARRLAAIRSLYRYLVREGRVRENPARLVATPKLPRHLPVIPSTEQVNRFLDGLAGNSAAAARFVERDRAILELLYGCGIRVSELTALSPDDLDFSSGALRVKGKGKKERIVPFGSKAAQALDVYLPAPSGLLCQLKGRHRAAPPLFINLRGARLTARSVGRIVKACALRLGLAGDLHPHSFRHAFASHLLGEGADLRAIQEMLGHSTLSTTQKYTHTSIRQLMEVYDKAHPKA